MDEKRLYRYIALASLVVAVLYLLSIGFSYIDKNLPVLNKIVDYGILPFLGTWLVSFMTMAIVHFIFQYIYLDGGKKPIFLITIYVIIIGVFAVVYYINVL